MNDRATALALEPAPLNVLIVEDSEEDTDLLVLELRRSGFSPIFRRVDTPQSLAEALEAHTWDLILSDYSMPQMTMRRALEMVQERQLDVPFLIVSATIGEEAAVEAMRAGAHDYILKDRLARLVPAVRRELKEAELRRNKKSLEEQFRQAQKLESLGLLAGGVAHDFNNLLTGILGNASLVLELLSPPEPERSMLQDVIRASERAAELTRQLLAYAGKGRFVVQPVDLSALVREIGELVRSSIPRQVDVRMDLQPDLPLIEADSSQIQQLVMNLVINAAEAIGDQTGVVEISSGVRHTAEEPESAPGLHVYLRVHDNGCGMDEATKAQIFDPFFTTKFTGRGLGLAAAQGIVRSHGGSIRVESRPGAGSTFQVVFPAIERRAELRESGTAVRHNEVLAGSGLVLVVDDEDLVRRAARMALQQYGYAVLEAENGKAAVDLFARMGDRIALVLLDLTMPVMSGDEAYRHLKAMRRDVPVIVSSGYDESEAARRFHGLGMVDFIKKPYVAQKLAQQVKDSLSQAARAV